MSLILSIETSTKAFSVALHEEGKLLADFEMLVEKSHSRVITLAIEQLFVMTNRKMADLKAVAVSKGPGSYTGLRIGVSTAKGLCFALDIPLIAINTLEAMAFEVNRFNPGYLVCPMIDARRMEVYCTVMDKDSQIIRPTEAVILNEDSFNDLLDTNSIFFCGDGSEKAKTLFNKPNAFFIDNLYPSAKNIGFLAGDRFRARYFEDVAYFEPFYLKDFISTGGTHGK
ncbi:MAG TPA: tRNA (adenosine(37)-N6)-threonylcarbamoyltransferase complex dimerization subunit type 1 TsaB [Cytophagaceae bacterium]